MSDHPHTDRELLLIMNEKLDTLIKCKNDHEERIRSLEMSFWKVVGLTAFISFLAGIIGGKLGGIFGGFDGGQ